MDDVNQDETRQQPVDGLGDGLFGTTNEGFSTFHLGQPLVQAGVGHHSEG